MAKLWMGTTWRAPKPPPLALGAAGGLPSGTQPDLQLHPGGALGGGAPGSALPAVGIIAHGAPGSMEPLKRRLLVAELEHRIAPTLGTLEEFVELGLKRWKTDRHFQKAVEKLHARLDPRGRMPSAVEMRPRRVWELMLAS